MGVKLLFLGWFEVVECLKKQHFKAKNQIYMSYFKMKKSYFHFVLIDYSQQWRLDFVSNKQFESNCYCRNLIDVIKCF